MTDLRKTDIEVTALMAVIERMIDDLKDSKRSKYRNELSKLQNEGIVRRHLESPNSIYVPAVMVRNYNEETGETEDGTVIDETLNTYLVIPDYNLQMTVRWEKMNCDVLR